MRSNRLRHQVPQQIGVQTIPAGRNSLLQSPPPEVTPIGPPAWYVIAGPRRVATPPFQIFLRALSDEKPPAAGSTGPQNVQGSPVVPPGHTWISRLEGKGIPRSLFQGTIGAFNLGHDLLLGFQPILLLKSGDKVPPFSEEISRLLNHLIDHFLAGSNVHGHLLFSGGRGLGRSDLRL